MLLWVYHFVVIIYLFILREVGAACTFGMLVFLDMDTLEM